MESGRGRWLGSGEFAMLPVEDLAPLASLMRDAESLGCWPRAATQARVALIPKGGALDLVPSAEGLRAIIILSALFRGWGAARSGYVKLWAKRWALPVQAGLPGGPSVEALTWALGALLESARRLGGGCHGPEL